MNVTSPATPSASRDVATIYRVGHADSSAEATDAAAATTCSQLSITTSALRPPSDDAIVSTSERPGCSRSPMGAATA